MNEERFFYAKSRGMSYRLRVIKRFYSKTDVMFKKNILRQNNKKKLFFWRFFYICIELDRSGILPSSPSGMCQQSVLNRKALQEK